MGKGKNVTAKAPTTRKEKIKWFFWPTLLPGIGGVVAAIRAIYLIAALWEWENIRVYKREPGFVHKLVYGQIKAMESEMEEERERKGGDSGIREGLPPRSDWQFMLNRRRTASTAWAIWAAVQFASGGMVVAIISLAVRC